MSTLNRRHFLAATAAAVATPALSRAIPADPAASAASRPTTHPTLDESAYTWHNVKPWGIEGQGFPDQTESDYDRLPAAAHGVVRPVVWNLSRDSAGMSVAFQTKTTAVAARYTLTSDSIAMPHMPATGVSGVDLYGTDAHNRYRFIASSRPTTQHYVGLLIKDMDPVLREYRLYFPLYNGIKHLEIGLPKGTDLTPIAPRRQGAVIYYGTSIAQGGCVSRPGNAFTSMLSRRLDRPFINLAFSGNGKMEDTVGRFITQINDPALYVIDCLPNMTTEEVKERTIPLVKQLHTAQPETPILLVEDRTHDDQWVSTKAQSACDSRRQALRTAYNQLAKDHHPHVHYLEGDTLIGTDGEATVDGSHPNDLGSMRYTDALYPILKNLLS